MNEIVLKEKFGVLTSGDGVSIKARLDEAKRDLESCLEYQIVKRLESELKAFEEKRDIFMKEILDDMKSKNIKEISDSGFKFKVVNRKSKACIIKDEKIIPEKYFRIKKEVNKELLNEDLKQGIFIEGVELEERNNEKLEIRMEDL